jgi:hypothetical protein
MILCLYVGVIDASADYIHMCRVKSTYLLRRKPGPEKPRYAARSA